jgi:hypothetical protein
VPERVADLRFPLTLLLLFNHRDCFLFWLLLLSIVLGKFPLLSLLRLFFPILDTTGVTFVVFISFIFSFIHVLFIRVSIGVLVYVRQISVVV